jgi:two-component system response regulator HydG
MAKAVRAISPEAMTRLVRYAWPGNVRELEHAMERAVILARGATVGVRDLPPEVAEGDGAPLAGAPGGFDLRTHEERLIRQALERFGHSRKRAAEALGISPVTLWRKVKEYGL